MSPPPREEQFEQYKTVSDQLLTESEVKSEETKPKVVTEDLGLDMEEDIKTQNPNNLESISVPLAIDDLWVVH